MPAYFAVTKEGICFVPGPDKEGCCSIHFFSFPTGRASPILALDELPDGGITVSPDGRTLFYAQIDQQGSDLMLADNFRRPNYGSNVDPPALQVACAILRRTLLVFSISQ
ncbi:MAG: hypothetical protein JJE04_25150 [Acidobacteriia bacterium]|nr:hypothetical protein [Terriglobia bacterium]